MLGLAAAGALLVQILDNQELIDFYIVKFQSPISASFFIVFIWIARAVLVVSLNRFNYDFIQQIKSGIQIRQCNVAFGSKSRSDQIETGRLFTALTNEVQMLTGQVFFPLAMGVAEAMLTILFLIAALFVMPMGILLVLVVVISGYLIIQRYSSPITNRLGKKRLEAEKDWSEKIVNVFALRREADAYGVTGRIKDELVGQIKIANKISGKFLAISPLNRAAIETVGIFAILGLLLLSDRFHASNGDVMFIILALLRMLPSATRILSAVQSYRFASPVILKQLAYLQQYPSEENFKSNSRIEASDGQITYYFREGLIPKKIELSLNKKQLVVITGESGLGKTTMLDELVEFLIAKRDIECIRETEICYAGQDNLVTEKSVRQNLSFYRDLQDAKISDGIKLLQGWGITAEHFDPERRVTDFSSGQKKRVAIARALNSENSVIVLDEPTAGLDEAIAKRVIRSICSKANHNLIIIATHDRNLIEAANVVFELKKAQSHE